MPRPPGLAFGEPDDRLQRSIQYVTASRLAFALRPVGRRGTRTIVSGAIGWRWPHDPQRSGLAADGTAMRDHVLGENKVGAGVAALGAADGPGMGKRQQHAHDGIG
jgi:hypothetical protein